MDPNAPTTAATTATTTTPGGYPVLPHQPQPYGQQFPFQPDTVPSFPQARPPSQPQLLQQQQHSFGAVPFSQPGAGPGGSVMPTTGFPQHSSGTS